MTTQTLADRKPTDATAVAERWIDGEWIGSDAVSESINPATGAVLGRWADGGEAEARAAIAAARRAFDATPWSRDRRLVTLRHAAAQALTDTGTSAEVAPGQWFRPTRTEGVETAEGIDFAKLPVPMMSPERVVRKALRSIGKRSFVIPGRLNRFMDVIGKSVTPRSIQTRMFGVLLKRALDEDPNRRAA